MTEIVLIADSGGTKTDWCAVMNGERIFFETGSCHPANWNAAFWDQLRRDLQAHVDLPRTNLYFFGAGCLNTENRLVAEAAFQKMNFNGVNVKSDLHGAGYALFGKKEGVGIISGTGSVLFYWKDETILKHVGGKGHLIGDEGSGFYFGKLLREKWRNNALLTTQKKVLNPTVREILTTVNTQNEKFALASLSKLLQNHVAVFRDLHEANINAFIATHFEAETPDQVALLGGYGFGNQSLWRTILAKSGIELTVVLEKPIVSLVERMESFID